MSKDYSVNPSCVKNNGLSPSGLSSLINSVDISGGQTRITCPPQLVYSIDTLKVSLWLEWADHSFLDLIQTRKEVVQQTDMQSCPFDFWGTSWNLYRIGNSTFPYHLSTGDIHLWLNNRKHDGTFPTASIEIGSLSSWVPGAAESSFQVFRFLQVQGATIIKELVSRADFACDCIDIHINDIGVDNTERWITRANKFSVHRSNNKLTGITYGKGDLMLRIYDKVQELKEKRSTAKQNLFSEIWKVSTYDEKPITRVEFQIRREVLKQFEEKSGKKIETVKQLMFAQNSLWEYFTGQWARHTRRSIDRKNKAPRCFKWVARN